MNKVFTAALAAASALGVAHADESAKSYFGVGQVHSTFDSNAVSYDIETVGSQIIVGTRFTPNLSGELNLVTFSETTVDDVKLEVSATNLSVLYHVNQGAGFFGRLGISNGDITLSGTGTDFDGSASDGPFQIGFGYDFAVGANGIVRAEYNSATYEDASELETTTFGINVLTKF